MKTLYMVRHAKSSWSENVGDHQRGLKERGVNDAKLVSEKAAETCKKPNKIISSDAVRAKSTATFFKDAFKITDIDFSTNSELYDFSGQNVMAVIKNLSDDLDIAMIVGHNHAFTFIANMLGNEFIENVPTSGFIQIDFDVASWQNISTGVTKLTIFPRDLK